MSSRWGIRKIQVSHYTRTGSDVDYLTPPSLQILHASIISLDTISYPARRSHDTSTQPSTITTTTTRFKVSKIKDQAMLWPSAAHSSEPPLDPTAPSWTAPQRLLGEMATLGICVQESLDTPASETDRPDSDGSVLPTAAAAVPVEVSAHPSSTSRAPPTPPDSDSDDINDRISSAHTEPAICSAGTNPIVTIDRSQSDHLRPNSFPCGTIIWAKPRGNDRYWIVMQSYFYHCVVLPIFTFNYKGLRGELRLAEREYVSIKDSGTRGFENQRPEVEPLVTTGKVNRGLHARSVVHITSPSFVRYNNHAIQRYGSFETYSMFRLISMYLDFQLESNQRARSSLPPIA